MLCSHCDCAKHISAKLPAYTSLYSRSGVTGRWAVFSGPTPFLTTTASERWVRPVDDLASLPGLPYLQCKRSKTGGREGLRNLNAHTHTHTYTCTHTHTHIHTHTHTCTHTHMHVHTHDSLSGVIQVVLK